MRKWFFFIYCLLLFHYYQKLVKTHIHTHKHIHRLSSHVLTIQQLNYTDIVTMKLKVSRDVNKREKDEQVDTIQHRIMPEDNHINGYYVIISISIFTHQWNHSHSCSTLEANATLVTAHQLTTTLAVSVIAFACFFMIIFSIGMEKILTLFLSTLLGNLLCTYSFLFVSAFRIGNTVQVANGPMVFQWWIRLFLHL